MLMITVENYHQSLLDQLSEKMSQIAGLKIDKLKTLFFTIPNSPPQPPGSRKYVPPDTQIDGKCWVSHCQRKPQFDLDKKLKSVVRELQPFYQTRRILTLASQSPPPIGKAHSTSAYSPSSSHPRRGALRQSKSWRM